VDVLKIIQEEIKLFLESDKDFESKLKEIYPGTFLYQGVIDSYHLSTAPDLELGKSMDEQNSDLKNAERGGSGDYIYASNSPKEWLRIFKDEGVNMPNHLYEVTLTNPKYKKSFELFGKKTPEQFLANPENVLIKKYLGKI